MSQKAIAETMHESVKKKVVLSDDFIKQYEGKSPNWGPFGEVIYARTYSRWLPEKNRRERWQETVKRVVEYSFWLYPEYGPASEEDLLAEAKQMYDLIWNLKAFPAGRTLWVGGSAYSFTPQGAPANFNCAFQDIESAQSFYDLVILLMSGCGVGFRVTQDNVEKLEKNIPFSGRKIAIEIEPYEYVGKPGLLEETNMDVHGTELIMTIGDSRKGWAKASVDVVTVLTSGEWAGETIDKLTINVNYVRPQGTRLKTFGGFASGPEPLEEYFLQAREVLYENPLKWTDTKALDLSNMIGRMVVAGGTRRSAQIALGDSDEFASAKTGEWWSKTSWRSQSNNSLMLNKKPSREKLIELFEHILQFGEPGFVNEVAAQKRRPRYRGTNPCGEILLDHQGFCNLTTVNLPSFIIRKERDETADEKKEPFERLKAYIDVEGMAMAFKTLSKHNLRITNLDMSAALPDWNTKQQRDRLLGMSFTGYGDLIDALSLTNEEQGALLAHMRSEVKTQAREYAYEMRIPEPLLVTTVKPEGTISQLAGVSSGLHPNYGPYYVRRVRISKVDAVAQALVMAGFQPKPENGFKTLEDAHTWVFEFPVSTPAQKKLHDYSALEQLERYMIIMRNWCDHNASNTIYISKEEVPGVLDWLEKNWDDYVSISFLPKSDKTFELMPYENISKEKFEELKKGAAKLSALRQYLESYESGGMKATEDFEKCDTGACPVR